MRTVLVTGATGNQGGATARALLARGWRVRALVRDVSSASATALADAGAELVPGDMTDRESLSAAAKDAYGVFSVQPAASPPHRDSHEADMGRNVADAAAGAGVEHLVYTSVASVDRPIGASFWSPKRDIEEYVRALGLPATFLRPVQFMENHASRGPFGAFGETAMVRMIPADSTIQVIAAADIGAFAALAFTDPERFVGQAIELAGDELTRDQLAGAIADAIGHPVNTDPLPDGVLTELRQRIENYRGGSFAGWQADIPALRALHPGLMTFDAWLERGGAAKLAALLD